jgi:hypothetical protein
MDTYHIPSNSRDISRCIALHCSEFLEFKELCYRFPMRVTGLAAEAERMEVKCIETELNRTRSLLRKSNLVVSLWAREARI